MAVLAVLAVVVIWRYTIKGKGVPAARLAALLCAIAVAWVLIAINDGPAAGSLIQSFASGINHAAAGLGTFLSHF